MRKILLIILFFTNQLFAQAPNDCVNAITVCGNGAFMSNASGIGSTEEVQNTGCGGIEHNSVWLKITIAQSGTLGFDLTPNNPSILVDYDFWVYGPNVTCTALGNAIRCATTNPNMISPPPANNLTGMHLATLDSQVGPGAHGFGYVRSLTVVAGQTYYIAIDRPVGNDGFRIDWTGSSTLGAGAFPLPPTANSIGNIATCSSTPNIGIFDLNVLRPSINSDLITNTISFHTNLANATDNISPLSNIYANTSNNQTIYARVTNNTSKCYSIATFVLVVNPIPTATISVSNSAICAGNSVTVSFSGSPNAVINYTIGGGSVQTATLDGTGAFSFVETPTIDTTYALTNVKNVNGSGVTICSQPLNISRPVTVTAIPTVSISGSTTICAGNSANVLFTGTPNVTVSYNINSGANQTISLDGTGNFSLPTGVLSVTATYNLVSVSTAIAPFCSQNITNSATITVITLPTATISTFSPVCSGNSTTVNFSGTPNAVVTYNINSGSNQTLTLNNTGNFSLISPILTANTTYNLVSVSTVIAPFCSQSLTGVANIVVTGLPTASISGTSTICAGNSTTINFTGTPNATVTYNINSGSNQTVLLDGTGNFSLPTGILSSTATYNLVGVLFGCSQAVSGSAIITVLPSPTATISGSTTICTGNSSTVSFSGTPNATVTYNINSGANQTISLDGTGNFSLPTGVLSANATYNLISVTSTIAPFCSKTLSGTVSIIVSPIPTIIATPNSQTLCSGQTTSITLSSSVVGTTFSWTVAQTGISGAIAGSGNTISQALSTTGLVNGSAIYTITPSINGCLGATSTVTITVKPAPIITATPIAESICSGNNTSILLSSNLVGTTFSWTATSINSVGATNGTGNSIIQNLSALTNASGTATYVITPTFNGCQGASTTVIVTVSPRPIVIATPSSNTICSGENTNIVLTSTDIGTTYNWTVATTGVTGASAGSGSSINQILTVGIVQGTATYTITPSNGGCVGLPINVFITVNPKPIMTPVIAPPVCSGGTTSIALSSNMMGTTFTWTAIQSGVSGASNGSGSTINQTLTSTSNLNGLVNYLVTPTNNGCIGTPLNISVSVNSLPNIVLNNGVICLNPIGGLIKNHIFNTGLSNSFYSFKWYFQGNLIIGATQNSYTATQIGTYGVEITNIATSCKSNIINAIVTASIPGQSVSTNQPSVFSDNPTIEVTVSGGNGTYLYQIDNGIPQFSNVFSSVSSGVHSIKVTDTNGCTNLIKSILVMTYPKFFTPNGDGVNDYWQIPGLSSIGSTKVLIFDRFGALIYAFKPNSAGWDGTQNGTQNIATDYWFVVDYLDNGDRKEFKAHFSLKR